MRLNLCLTAILVPLFALPATAEVTGGEVALSYSAFTKDGDVNRTSLEGSMEYGFDSNFTVQGDIALHRFGAVNENANTVTLHGIGHLNDATSLGAFIGRDHAAGGSATVYGIEAGQDLGRVDIEGYLAGYHETGSNGTLIGANARYAYTPDIGFGAGFDYGGFGGSVDLTRFGVNADYTVTNGPTLSAELGQLHANGFGLSGNEAYAKIGIGFKFGAKRGVTFGNRSLTRLLPGL